MWERFYNYDRPHGAHHTIRSAAGEAKLVNNVRVDSSYHTWGSVVLLGELGAELTRDDRKLRLLSRSAKRRKSPLTTTCISCEDDAAREHFRPALLASLQSQPEFCSPTLDARSRSPR